MENKRITFYGKLVYAAYGFFLLFGLIWFLTTLFKAGSFNYTAFVIILVFAVQSYYRNKLANLLIGIVSLFLSFFMMMEVLNTFDLLSKNADFGIAAKVLLLITLLSISFSGILIFSYMKLNNADDNSTVA